MVQLPTPQDLKRLTKFKEPFCVSIYVPHIEFDPSGATNPNKIELKNMLAQAEVALADGGVEPRQIKKTLLPAWEMLGNSDLWPPRQESLALFLHPKFSRYYYLPDEVPHMLTVSRGFNLAPLLAAIGDNLRYLVLALSHKNVRMFEGDRFHIKQLRLKNFPTDMEESLHIDEYPKVAETHTIAPAGNGKGSEAFHGQYNANQTDKQMLLQFFRLMDTRLRKFLQTKNEPLIIAGVEYLLPIYRQANTSPYLMPGGLTGNFEHVKPDSIRQRAWALIKKGSL